MVDHQYIELSLVSPESLVGDSGDWLKIVQPEWVKPSVSGFADWLRAENKGYSLQTYFEYWAQYTSMCNGDGNLEVEIQIHRSRLDLDYSITASWGALSDPFEHTTEHTSSETIKNASERDLGVYLIGAVSATWEGAVLDETGGVVSPPPTVTSHGSVISWAQKVTGVLRLKYTEQHDAYILTITPRPAAESDPNDSSTAYQSTVFAVWGGGKVEDQEVDLPDMSGYCGGGSSMRVNPDDPDGLDPEKCYRHIVTVDACEPDEILGKRDEEIVCPEDSDDETNN